MCNFNKNKVHKKKKLSSLKSLNIQQPPTKTRECFMKQTEMASLSNYIDGKTNRTSKAYIHKYIHELRAKTENFESKE